MYYFILALVIIALISIAYVWYITRGTNIISDDQPLELQGNDNKLLDQWYQTNIKSTVDLGLNNHEIAATFIERLFDKKVNPEHIVIGKIDFSKNNLAEQYYNIVQKWPETNIYFNLRDLIGKPWELLIIPDKDLRSKFNEEEKEKEKVNLNELNDIMLSNLDKGAFEFMKDLLNNRWRMINELNDDDVINNEGSYLYIKINDLDKNSNEVIVKDNIVAARTIKGARINLLCNNWEFETLMKRLKSDVIVSF